MKLPRLLLCLLLALPLAGRAQSFIVNSLIVGTPDPAPTLVSATLGTVNTTLTLAFSENVFVGAGGNGGFTVTLSGGAATLTYASGSGSDELVYTVSRPVAYDETGTLAYTQPGSGVEDSIGSDLASFSGFTLTNTISSEPDTTTTSIPHDEFLEGFQDPSVGYEQSWSFTSSAAYTVPYDSSALSANKPADAKNRARRHIIASGDSGTYSQWTRGSNISRSTSNLDVVFYIYVSGWSATSTVNIAQITNTGGTSVMSVQLVKSAGVVTLQALGSTNSTAVTISENQWVKVHIHLNTTAANCYFEAGNEGAYVTTNTFTRPSQDYGAMRIGTTANKDATDSGTIYWDLICWNTP